MWNNYFRICFPIENKWEREREANNGTQWESWWIIQQNEGDNSLIVPFFHHPIVLSFFRPQIIIIPYYVISFAAQKWLLDAFNSHKASIATYTATFTMNQVVLKDVIYLFIFQLIYHAYINLLVVQRVAYKESIF